MTGTLVRRIVLRIEGASFERWTSMELVRSLEEISGSFELEYHDSERTRRALPRPANPQPPFRALKKNMACTITIDDETVLVGWIDDVKLAWAGEQLSASVTGRDRTGDLVDCAAAPTGPAEFRNLTLAEIARRICQPFGITVRVDTDVGGPLPLFSIDVGETALSALEKAARQRAVLLVSDGVGGLLLTRSGASRGPAPLQRPGNVQEGESVSSGRECFSVYYVKGQSRGGGQRGDSTAAPLTADSVPVPAASRPRVAERRGIIITGRAEDPEVGRYRPTVRQTKTQSGGVSAQQQAEWMRRVARGKSDRLTFTVLDWRAGEDRKLWRLNELVAVTDPYAMVSGDMLISRVTYSYSEQGAKTSMELVGPEAYDLLPEEPRRRARQRNRTGGDSRAEELNANPVAAVPPRPGTGRRGS